MLVQKIEPPNPLVAEQTCRRRNDLDNARKRRVLSAWNHHDRVGVAARSAARNLEHVASRTDACVPCPGRSARCCILRHDIPVEVPLCSWNHGCPHRCDRSCLLLPDLPLRLPHLRRRELVRTALSQSRCLAVLLGRAFLFTKTPACAILPEL